MALVISSVVFSLIVLFIPSVSLTEAQDCTLPTPEKLRAETIIRVTNDPGGAGPGAHVIPLQNWQPWYTCLAQGYSKGRYRELSVIMNYEILGISSSVLKQFELDCNDGEWESRVGSLSSVPLNWQSLGAWTGCNSCINFVPNDNHCVG